MKNEECIFCKIVEGEVPCERVWEGEKFFAFADANPAGEGHTLVVPKKHFQSLEEVDGETLESFMGAIKEVGKLLVEKHRAGGFNVALNNGEVAGQVVNHVHFHILPRKEGDGLKLSFK